MKIYRHPLLAFLLVAAGLIINPATRAQEEATPKPVAPPTVEAISAAETPAPPATVATATTEVETPATEVAPLAVETPAPEAVPAATAEAPTEAPAETTVAGEDGLRRLDEPASEAVASESDETTGASVTETTSEEQATIKVSSKQRRRQHSNQIPFGNHTIAVGNKVFEAVSILGSTTVNGEVEGPAVSILGDTRVNGSTGREAVAVLGNVFVDGTVGGEVVAVLGDVTLGPKAVVQGDVIVVGGRIISDAAAVVKGDRQEVSFLGDGDQLVGLKTWFKECLMWGRPLAFGRNLGWAWLVAGAVFSLYILLALLFPRAFEKCAETLEQRPGSSLLAVVLTVLITPVLIVLLVITGVGLLLIPFVAAGLFFAGIFGKAVMHAWLGRRITRYFGPGPMSHVAVATLIGSVLVLLLYTVPFLGFFVFKVLDVIGLGVVVYTIILSTRREKQKSVVAATAPASPLAAPLMPLAAVAGAGAATTETSTGAPLAPPPLAVAGASLPRAGFWIRLAATGIDAVLIGIVVGFTNTGAAYPALFAVYCVVLWALKGTTIGGIVCGLKIVRLDDRKVDWMVAVVRGLGGFLSLAVAGLGFLWVAFDDQKQSWHDKIAGTTIVQVPKGMSLL
jgi:uncharacterized RDD family membrane protein YckC